MPVKLPARRLATWVLTGAVLLGVFALYLQPSFMVDIANQLWGCF